MTGSLYPGEFKNGTGFCLEVRCCVREKSVISEYAGYNRKGGRNAVLLQDPLPQFGGGIPSARPLGTAFKTVSVNMRKQ